jgi:hypothetical protein
VDALSSLQPHRCLVQTKGDGGVYLSFAPTDGGVSSFSNSQFTLDLRAGATRGDADALAKHINSLLHSVSTTIF